jgi:hypothetical protein
MEDYERSDRIWSYKAKGFYIGAVLGFAGGFAAQHYLAEAQEYVKYFLNVLSGFGGGFVIGAIGYAAGSGIGKLVNNIIEAEERNMAKRKQANNILESAKQKEKNTKGKDKAFFLQQ